MTPEEFHDDFFKNYRGRYSSYWVERWGLIPSIPTSFDNANSIYELLAWLQRAFKQLLDDFVALESEFEDYKNALTELLEYLIPLLIRRYMASKEADDWFNNKADIYYNKIIKPYIDSEIAKVNKRIDPIEHALNKIIENLEGSGAWTGGLNGDFNSGRNIATGNINLFGGTPDGHSFIRTNSGSTENDLAGGI